MGDPRGRTAMSRRRYDDDYDDRLEPHRGQTILILGVVAIALVHLLGPFVWWMGATDLRKMRDGVMDRRGEEETRIGYVLGIIATCLLGVAVLAAMVVIGLFLFGFLAFAGAAAAR
jgi:uncharacterized Tic20 family protein